MTFSCSIMKPCGLLSDRTVFTSRQVVTRERSVTVLSSQPSVMVYTGNWLAGGCPETKTGGRYDDYDGVAIECQNYPDAVNHPDFPSPLLRPGELYCQKIVFRFGTF